jgi:hypothetical protein
MNRFRLMGLYAAVVAVALGSLIAVVAVLRAP